MNAEASILQFPVGRKAGEFRQLQQLRAVSTKKTAADPCQAVWQSCLAQQDSCNVQLLHWERASTVELFNTSVGLSWGIELASFRRSWPFHWLDKFLPLIRSPGSQKQPVIQSRDRSPSVGGERKNLKHPSSFQKKLNAIANLALYSPPLV